MTKRQMWKTILGELELEIPTPTFKTFLAPTKLIDLKDNTATIGCPNPAIANTIETRYYTIIKQKIDSLTNNSFNLVFTIDKSLIATKKQKDELPLFSSQKNQKEEKKLEIIIRQAGLNPLFTFENFAVSATNQMAYAAATAVVKNPGKAYNPLFLWGGVGVGKTHLMQAIGQAILKKNPKTRVIYCMGEEFTNEIIDAIQTKTTKQFKKKYRSAKVLLIDDVQFIAGKNTVQEEFFHTFETVYRAGGQIVLISDKPPHEINELEDRLRSRFEGGLTIDVPPPDFELRSAILRIKAEQRKINLPMDVAQLIAANITDTRKLEGTLIRLITEAKTKRVPISLELAKNILGKTETEDAQLKTISPREVLKIIAKYYGIRLSQLQGKRRKRDIAVPRQIAMYFLRKKLGIRLVEIGKFLGGRDHTTIMHGVDKITKELLINEQLRQDILGIKKIIYG